MKILEILQPKIASGPNGQTPQDLVAQDIVPEALDLTDKIEELKAWETKFNRYRNDQGSELAHGYLKAMTDTGIMSDGWEAGEWAKVEQALGDESEWEDGDFEKAEAMSPITQSMTDDLVHILGVDSVGEDELDAVGRAIGYFEGTEETCVSSIAEGISRILRRKYGKGVVPGFRCTSGPRKGRVVVKPETCFARLNPVKGAKIAQKRQMRARSTAQKRARTMRSGGGSQRLQKIQIDKGRHSAAPLKRAGRLQKSKVVKPKKK
jgi:hypothetical protein